MNFSFYTAVSSLAVRFAHFLIGLWKRVLPRHLFLFFFVHRICLEYSSSDESDEYDGEESENLDLNPGQLVCLVLYFDGFYVA